MSDTVEAAIIGAIATLLAAAIGVIAVIAHNRKTHRQSHTVPKNDINIPVTIPNASHGMIESASRHAGLTHKQISDTIKAVPPLQRDGIAASFIGTYVSWRGKLYDASKHDDETSVSLSDVSEDGGLVHCHAKSRNCVDLLIARQGTELIVRGKIKDVYTHGATLEDCTFETP
jgi:hypothetical protein